MKKSIFSIVLLLPFIVTAQKSFTITGELPSAKGDAIAYLLLLKNGAWKDVDSTEIENGKFIFTGSVDEPHNAIIGVKHNGVRQRDSKGFYIENSKIFISSVDSMKNAIVKGSATDDEEKALREVQRPFKSSADSLTAVYWKLAPEQRKDTAWMKAAGIVMRATQAGYDSVTRAFIAMNPQSYISLLMFREVDLAYNFNPDTAEARFSRFPDAIKASPMGKKLAAIIETGKKTNTGVMAMDFQQNDTTGKAVRLSDFRGKYVLLDFWASWCAPCRAENPIMLAAYNKYKDHNFTILGVSLDDAEGRRAWLGAVKQDKLPWTQISDLKGFKSEAAVLYGITAIPANFLIDPDGKIIGRNLRGEDLEKKLSTLF